MYTKSSWTRHVYAIERESERERELQKFKCVWLIRNEIKLDEREREMR